MLKIYQRRINAITPTVNGAVYSYAGLNLSGSVIVLAAAKRLIKSCDRIQMANGMMTTEYICHGCNKVVKCVRLNDHLCLKCIENEVLA